MSIDSDDDCRVAGAGDRHLQIAVNKGWQSTRVSDDHRRRGGLDFGSTRNGFQACTSSHSGEGRATHRITLALHFGQGKVDHRFDNSTDNKFPNIHGGRELFAHKEHNQKRNQMNVPTRRVISRSFIQRRPNTNSRGKRVLIHEILHYSENSRLIS